MKFSISLPTGFEGVMYPIPFVDPADFVRLATLCERLGYHSVWGNDHITTQDYVRGLFPGTPPNFYELLTVLSFCAAATTTLKVGTAVAVLPMRDPFWLAKQAATIDQMSGGRLILGVGIGAYREEFAAWAPRLSKDARRGDMLDEGLALMQRLFAELRVTHDGKYYACRDIEMFPKPKQKPFALFIGGHNMENVERAARVGAGWLPGWRPWPELAERIKVLKERDGRTRPRSVGDRDRTAIFGDGRQDRGGSRTALHGLGPRRAPQVARLYGPRPFQAGGREPDRLARHDPRKSRGP